MSHRIQVQIISDVKTDDGKETWVVVRPDGTATLSIDEDPSNTESSWASCDLSHAELRTFCESTLKALDNIAAVSGENERRMDQSEGGRAGRAPVNVVRED